MVSGMLKTELSGTTDKYFGLYLIYLIYCPQGLRLNCLIEYVTISFSWLNQKSLLISLLFDSVMPTLLM